jgi:hypothetical protein
MTAILLALGSSVGYGVSDFLASRVARRAMPRPPLPILLALVAAVCFGLFFVGVDLGGEAAGGSVLWVALGVQVGALATTLVGALPGRGRRLGLDDRALLWPVGVLTVLNLSAA